MICAMIVCGTLAIAMPFVISGVALRLGAAVSERFLERPGSLPAEVGSGPGLTASLLKRWATQQTTVSHAKGYAHLVMPLDIAYLIFLGTFLGFAATHMAVLASPNWLSTRPGWVWWILPAAYMASDLAEDILIFVFLTWPSSITDFGLKTLSAFKWTKIGTNCLAIVQILLLALLVELIRMFL